MEQHFLTNRNKLEALVRSAQIGPGDRVLELGAGGGTVAAVLPVCRLTLVELEPALATSLRNRFPDAAVLQEDALAALGRLDADVILSNLPHTLTPAVLARLRRKAFRRALVAAHADDAAAELGTLLGKRFGLTRLFDLEAGDFTPPQPFRSTVLQMTPF